MGSFSEVLQSAGKSLVRGELRCLQVNIGYRCNLQCSHCHVEAGPKRSESMNRAVMEAVLAFAEKSAVAEIDITGGAPELWPLLPEFLEHSRQLDALERLLVRTNLAILAEAGFADFFAGRTHVIGHIHMHHGVTVVFMDHQGQPIGQYIFFIRDSKPRAFGAYFFNQFCLGACSQRPCNSNQQ